MGVLLIPHALASAMHVFYFNIPWSIDEHEYNCSSRTFAEWKARGAVNEIQGVYFLISGIIFVTLYVLTLIGMVRGKLLRIPCYRLMFFNGFVDIMDLLIGSLAMSYLHFAGVVFCTHTFLEPLLGHMVWSLWIGAVINCIVLAFNRIVEMIPSMGGLLFLFRGKTLYTWMVLCVCIMVVRPFVTRPLLYNSMVSAFVGGPAISDDMTWEISHYTSVLVLIHNVSVIVILVTLYSVLCNRVWRMSQIGEGSLERFQLQIFLQSLVICTTTATAATLYVLVEIVPVPKAVVILASVVWQISHGSHGLVYMFLNRTIRREVLSLFGLRMKSSVHAVTRPTESAVPNESYFAEQ